jgi:signal transduction histidine kinase
MSRLISDLLDVTILEAGRLTLQRAELSPRQLVLDAVDSQKSLADAASLELRAEIADGLPNVFADRHRVLQAFENLVGNAAKFTPAGGAIIVRAAAAREGDMVVFSVIDTGAGIHEGDLPHLFDRFWHKGEHKGAGLGLAIVKGIVEAHGGHIWVESEPGRGSNFSFSLPCVRADTSVSS